MKKFPPFPKACELSGTESRVAKRTIPESQTWNRQNFRSENLKSESSLSKVESREIDSEWPIRITAYQCLKLLRCDLESHDSESPDSRFAIAKSMPLSQLLLHGPEADFQEPIVPAYPNSKGL